jgi:hypothetical protein
MGTTTPQLPEELNASRGSFDVVANPIPKEEFMTRPKPATGALHAEVHIDLCPNDSLHITIGNICLHLCQQDFLQLAQAVQEAMAQFPQCVNESDKAANGPPNKYKAYEGDEHEYCKNVGNAGRADHDLRLCGRLFSSARGQSDH